MRLPVSFKVLGVFAALAATTVCLGVVVWFGLRDLRQTAGRVQYLKDFQIQIKTLERFSRAPRGPTAEAGAFDAEFRDAQALAAAIVRLGPELPAPLRPRVGALQEHLGFFRAAFGELFAAYETDRRLRREHRDREDAVHRRLGRLPAVRRLGAEDRADRVVALSGRSLDDRDGRLLADLRTLADSLGGASGDPELARLAQAMVLGAEKAYFNALAIRDKESFLAASAERFSEVAAATVEALSAASVRRQDQLSWAVRATVAAAGLLMLGLWVSARGYIRRALFAIDRSIRAIRSGRYDYEVPAIPDDEIGDVVLFLRELAEGLEEGLRRLTESEERYRSLVEDISDWVWETDSAGRFVYSSPVVRRLLGVDATSLLGRALEELMTPQAAARVGPVLRASLAEGEPVHSLEASFRSPEGTEVTLEGSWQVARAADGSVRGLRGISRDVTARKRAEDEQARLRAQLLQAQKLEAIGTLTGGIAHDFNNLLQSITGYTEMLLRKKAETDPDVPRLRTIERAAHRAAELTRQLLVFGRRVESRVAPVSLNAEIGQVCALLAHTIPRMIEVRARLAEDLWMVEADAVQLEQVLVNLAVNAKDAMPEGGVLEFATENVDEEAGGDLPSGRWVCLRVTDTGIGMDEATQEHIFDPFFTTKEVGKGTGLGLAIVYGIVQGHGGHVQCRSAPGRGSSFRVCLPAAAPASAAGEREAAEGETPRGSETVLLVDDEETLLDLCEDMLTQAGYEVLTASSGEAAVGVLVSGRRVDLVILDLNMPGMGGLECLRQARRAGVGAPFLVASGHRPDDAADELGRLGVEITLRKPFRREELLRTVRRALDGRGADGRRTGPTD